MSTDDILNLHVQIVALVGAKNYSRRIIDDGLWKRRAG